MLNLQPPENHPFKGKKKKKKENAEQRRVCWQKEITTELVIKRESTLAWLFGDGEN